MNRVRIFEMGASLFGVVLLIFALSSPSPSHGFYSTDRYYFELSGVGDIAYVFIDNDGTGNSVETIGQHSRGGFEVRRGKAGVYPNFSDLGEGPGNSGGPVEIGQYLLPGIHRLRFILLDYPASSSLSGPNPQTVSISWKVGIKDQVFQDSFQGAGMPCTNPTCSGAAEIVYDYMYVFEVKGCVPDLAAMRYRWLTPDGSVSNMPGGVEVTKVEEESLALGAGDPFAVSLTLDPGNMADQEADWWFLLVTPDGKIWSFVWPTGWKEGLFPAATAPLTELPVFVAFLSEAQEVNASGSFPIPFYNLGTDDYPPGNYNFVFGVDNVPNGQPDGSIWYDTVNVTVPAN